MSEERIRILGDDTYLIPSYGLTNGDDDDNIHKPMDAYSVFLSQQQQKKKKKKKKKNKDLTKQTIVFTKAPEARSKVLIGLLSVLNFLFILNYCITESAIGTQLSFFQEEGTPWTEDSISYTTFIYMICFFIGRFGGSLLFRFTRTKARMIFYLFVLSLVSFLGNFTTIVAYQLTQSYVISTSTKPLIGMIIASRLAIGFGSAIVSILRYFICVYPSVDRPGQMFLAIIIEYSGYVVGPQLGGLYRGILHSVYNQEMPNTLLNPMSFMNIVLISFHIVVTFFCILLLWRDTSNSEHVLRHRPIGLLTFVNDKSNFQLTKEKELRRFSKEVNPAHKDHKYLKLRQYLQIICFVFSLVLIMVSYHVYNRSHWGLDTINEGFFPKYVWFEPVFKMVVHVYGTLCSIILYYFVMINVFAHWTKKYFNRPTHTSKLTVFCAISILCLFFIYQLSYVCYKYKWGELLYVSNIIFTMAVPNTMVCIWYCLMTLLRHVFFLNYYQTGAFTALESLFSVIFVAIYNIPALRPQNVGQVFMLLGEFFVLGVAANQSHLGLIIFHTLNHSTNSKTPATLKTKNTIKLDMDLDAAYWNTFFNQQLLTFDTKHRLTLLYSHTRQLEAAFKFHVNFQHQHVLRVKWKTDGKVGIALPDQSKRYEALVYDLPLSNPKIHVEHGNVQQWDHKSSHYMEDDQGNLVCTMAAYISQQNGCLTWNERIDILIAILDVLLEVHEAQYFHGSLSSWSILFVFSQNMDEPKSIHLKAHTIAVGGTRYHFKKVKLMHLGHPIDPYHHAHHLSPFLQINYGSSISTETQREAILSDIHQFGTFIFELFNHVFLCDSAWIGSHFIFSREPELPFKKVQLSNMDTATYWLPAMNTKWTQLVQLIHRCWVQIPEPLTSQTMDILKSCTLTEHDTERHIRETLLNS